MMHVVRFRSLDELKPWAGAWNQLAAGIPFRTWEWQSGWWRHYGADESDPRHELFVLAAFDDAGALVGVAPWHLQQSAAVGRVVRFLGTGFQGTGEVCPEYQDVLSQPGREQDAAQAIAQWLNERVAPSKEAAADEAAAYWDLLDLSSVDAADRTTHLLTEQLADLGHAVYRRPAPPCWRIELPGHWDDYLARLSKSHRKQVRRAEKNYLSSGRAVLHTVDNPGDVPQAFQILVDLHQQRRHSIGEPGCFTSPRFAGFHRELVEELLAQNPGAVRLHWITLDGRPVAAEYHLAGAGSVYAYQAGLDPTALEHEPGHLAAIATLRLAIEQGFRVFDYLRGDEPYKAHWRAEPRAMIDLQVVPPTAAARLRHGVRSAGDSLKSWIKSGLELAGMGKESR